MYKHTLSADSAALNLATTTAVQPLVLAPGTNAPNGSGDMGDQIMSVDCVSSATGAAGTLALMLVDPNETTDQKVRIELATVTPTTYRSASAGASGGYICTVVFASTGTNKVDLNGHSQKPRSVSSAGVQGGEGSQKTQWYIGLAAAGGLGTVTACVTPVRAI